MRLCGASLRSLQDDATPSGNAIAARALLRLGALTLQPRFEEAARDIMESGAGELEAQPLAHASLALATLNYLQPQRQVIITGADSADMDTWKEAISGIDQVNCHVLQPGEALPGVTNGSTGFDRTTAYVCTGTRCLPPAESIDTLIKQLESA